MELAPYIKREAEAVLLHEGTSGLPKRLADTDFFVTAAHDGTIVAHGSVFHEGLEYKVGPMRDHEPPR